MDHPSLREALHWVGGFLSLGAVGGVVSFLVTRHYRQVDEHDNQRVTAYREVRASVAALRAAMGLLNSRFDFNQQVRQEDFAPTNKLHEETTRIIERNRADTGSEFADAATVVLAYWDTETTNMWEGNYNAEAISPSLKAREAALYDAIPRRFRKKVAPGGPSQN